MSERIVATDGHEGHWYTGEEIVRCRDCRWCMAYSKATYCDRFAHELPTVELDGFCAWGGEEMSDIATVKVKLGDEQIDVLLRDIGDLMEKRIEVLQRTVEMHQAKLEEAERRIEKLERKGGQE